MTPAEIHERIRAKFPDGVVQIVSDRAGDPFAIVRADALPDIARFLRDDPDLAFDYPTLVSGVDDGTDLWAVYHLYSIPKNHMVVLKVRCDRNDARVPSLVSVWKGVDWHERETYDMLGIVFEGHPDLRRILLPEDWEGHPLRKDYVFPEQHWGIPLR